MRRVPSRSPTLDFLDLIFQLPESDTPRVRVAGSATRTHSKRTLGDRGEVTSTAPFELGVLTRSKFICMPVCRESLRGGKTMLVDKICWWQMWRKDFLEAK